MPFSPLDALLQVSAPKRASDLASRQEGAGAFQPALEQAYRAESPRPATDSPPPPKPSTEPRSAANGQRHADDQPDQSAAGAEQAVAAEGSAEPQTEEHADAVEISEEATAAGSVSAAADHSEAKVIVAALADNAEETAVEKNAAAEGQKQESNAPGTEALPGDATLDAIEAEGDPDATDGEAPKMSSLHSSKQQKVAATTGDGSDPNASAEQPPAEPIVEVASATKSDAQLQAEAATEKARELSSAAREPGDDGQRDAAAEQPTTSPPRAVATTAVEAAPASVEIAAATETATVDAPTSTTSAPAQVAANAGAEAAPRSQRALDRLMAGHASRQTREGAEPNGMPTVDRARFVHRVEGAMRAAHQGDGRINVRLSPPDLGSVKIELALQNGVLSAKLEAETPAARNLLLDSLPALRERLAQQDIQIEKFDVDVRQEGGGQQGSGQADDRAPNHSDERPGGRPRTTSSRTPVLAATARDATASASNAGLDVRV